VELLEFQQHKLYSHLNVVYQSASRSAHIEFPWLENFLLGALTRLREWSFGNVKELNFKSARL
jgi:hypothetical protein